MTALLFVCGILIGLAFLASGMAKLTKQNMAIQMKEKLSLSDQLFTGIGIAEVGGASGVLISLIGGAFDWFGFFAGIGLVILMVGAIWTHINAKDKFTEMLPAVFLLTLCIVFLFVLPNR